MEKTSRESGLSEGAAGPGASPVSKGEALRRSLAGGNVAVLAALLALAGAVGFYLVKVNRPNNPDEERLCRQFMDWKNTGDRRANDLLGPAPEVPDVVGSEEEAERLHAESILHGDFQIVSIRPQKTDPAPPTPRFILEVKGYYSNDLQVATPEGAKRRSCSLFNPDVVVEVRDGKLVGLRTQVHEDPNQKPLSPRNRKALEDALGIKRQ